MQWYRKELQIAGMPEDHKAELVGVLLKGYVTIMVLLDINNKIYIAPEWSKAVGRIDSEVTKEQIQEKYQVKLDKIAKHHEEHPFDLWLKMFMTKVKLKPSEG